MLTKRGELYPNICRQPMLNTAFGNREKIKKLKGSQQLDQSKRTLTSDLKIYPWQ